MNRKTIVGVALSIVFAFVALRLGRLTVPTPIGACRPTKQERAYVTVLERTVNGFAEWYSQRVPLLSNERRIEWFATVFTDPSRPPFALVFRNASESQETWEADAKKAIAIVADGSRHVMKPFQATVSDDGTAVAMVSVGGPPSILEAVVATGKAEIEFGGKRYDLGTICVANLPRVVQANGVGKRCEVIKGILLVLALGAAGYGIGLLAVVGIWEITHQGHEPVTGAIGGAWGIMLGAPVGALVGIAVGAILARRWFRARRTTEGNP